MLAGRAFRQACCAGVLAGTLLNPAADNSSSVRCVIAQPTAKATRTAAQILLKTVLALFITCSSFCLFLARAWRTSVLVNLLVLKHPTPTVGKCILGPWSHMEKSATLLTPRLAGLNGAPMFHRLPRCQ